MGLTVACVQVGNYQERGAEYVNRLAAGVRRRLAAPHRFLCLTDDRQGLAPGIETLAAPVDLTGWWAKLWLFSPGLFRPGERVIFLDLDTLLVGPLDALADWSGDFAILRDFYRPDGYGSGVMLWRAGWGEFIWQSWCTAGQPEVPGGDQAWIERAHGPGADLLQDLWPGLIVSYKAHCQTGIPDGASVVAFHGKPKPHELPAVWTL